MEWIDKNGTRYGPFDRQADGYPNAGQVVRYYRRLKGYSATYVAQQLGDVTSRWVLAMEQKNKVPETITRRRAICVLLSIPPFLMGLSGDDDIIQDIPKIMINTGKNIDIELQKEALPILWNTSHSGIIDRGMIGYVNRIIDSLSMIDTQEAKVVLSGYYRLLSRLYRDKVAYDQAESSVVKSEQYAQEAKNEYLYASALLTHGRMLVEMSNVEKSVQYLHDAYTRSHNDTGGLHGTAAIELAMALARLPTQTRDRQTIDKLVKEAYKEADDLKDDKSYTALNSGILSVYRVDIGLQLNAKDGMEDAIEDAYVLMPPVHSWRHSLLDIYQAEYSLVKGELYGCLSSATRAYDTTLALESGYQLSLLRKLAASLIASKYAKEQEVQAFTRRVMPKKRTE